MTPKERAARTRLLDLRLASQRISESAFRDPVDTVRWLTAVQAQDFPAAKWAVGLRTPGSTHRDVEAALESGAIVRSWPMRGTLHFVAAEDLAWILGLTGQRMISGAQSRRDYHGITAADLVRAEKIAVKALSGNRRLTREEMHATFVRAKLSDNPSRGSHFLWHLSHVRVLCFGPPSGASQTFALFDEWIPRSRELDRDEALGELTLRYFRSHGPATLRDFAWWSSLSLGEIKVGLAVARSALAEITIDKTAYFLDPNTLEQKRATTQDSHALPAFDEYLLGYRDRDAQLDPAHGRMIVPGQNGVFAPTLVDRGRVVGTWKRVATPKGLRVTVAPFARLGVAESKRFAKAFARYGKFWKLPVTLAK